MIFDFSSSLEAKTLAKTITNCSQSLLEVRARELSQPSRTLPVRKLTRRPMARTTSVDATPYHM